MNAERLLALYEKVAEAPDAIACLRRFVLDLAVRGKLVAQDAGDEPASELLKRIAAEKARLVKAGEIKNSKERTTSQTDLPYTIPASWTWTTLGAIGEWGAGSTPSRSNPGLYGGGITWLKSGELGDRTDLKGSEETVTEKAVQTGSFRRNKPGDVLIAMYGATIGKLAILAEEAVTNQAVCGCTPFSGIHNLFLFLFLLAQRAAFQAASEGGAQPNISKVKIVGTAFPLPPLAEQRRIVAKVEELMALLDRLEAARTAREATRDRLTAASLARVTALDAAPGDFPTYARFALATLPALTARPDQIKPLRQTILNLAVRGKLVAQDPADEPASELLKRISAEKARLVKAGEFREPRSAIEIKRDDLPFAPPAHWLWARLIDIARPSYGFAFSSGQFNGNKRGMPLIRIRDISRTDTEAYYEGNYDPAYLVRAGDYLVGMDGDFNLRRWTGPDGLLNQRVMRINGWRCKIDSEFVRLPLQMVLDYLHGDTSLTTVKHLSAKQVNGIEIPLPPLAEQRRIVAKVEELMALLDRLEAALAEADTTRAHLLEALLHEALIPAVPAMAAAE